MEEEAKAFELSIEDKFWIQYQEYKAKAQAFDKQNAYIESRAEQIRTELNPRHQARAQHIAQELEAAAMAGTKYLMHFSGGDMDEEND